MLEVAVGTYTWVTGAAKGISENKSATERFKQSTAAFFRCVRRKELCRRRKSLPDPDGATVSHDAEATHDYLLVRYLCSVLGDQGAPVFRQELGRTLNSRCPV